MRDICFPFLVRLHRKENTFATAEEYQTSPQLLIEMVKVVAGWLPERRFYLAVDGGYANEVVFEGLPKNVVQFSRTRADASLYQLKPPPSGKRGRPRTKGDPTPKPRERVTDSQTEWTSLTVVMYGQEVVVEVVTWVGLWDKVAKDHPLRFVLVRDPKNHYHWACFLPPTPVCRPRPFSKPAPVGGVWTSLFMKPNRILESNRPTHHDCPKRSCVSSPSECWC
jgi:hypothetical protein